MSKEIPFFKFHSAEWLTGDISLENFRTQGMFIAICAEYWQRDCTLTIKCVKKRLKLNQKSLETLVKLDLISIQNDHVFIKFLDEQFSELSENHRKRVESGRMGGKQRASNASSNAQAIPKHIDIEVDKDIEVDQLTAFQYLENKFGMPRGIDIPTLVNISAKVSDVDLFASIADKIYTDADPGFKPGQLSLAQKAFAEYNQAEAKPQFERNVFK